MSGVALIVPGLIAAFALCDIAKALTRIAAAMEKRNNEIDDQSRRG